MKLVKINNVRVGQIWTFNEGQTYDLIIDVRNIDPNLSDCLYEVNYIIYGDLEYNIGHKKEKGDNYFIDAEYCRRDEPASNDILEKFKDMNNLVGFLGITHKIEDGKLIEIQREELGNTGCYIDDIFINEYEEVEGVVLGMSRDGYIRLLEPDGKDIYETGTITEKIGILGVNYQFINNKLVKEND